jgi:thiol-disulfide isomerase/thioredoxin
MSTRVVLVAGLLGLLLAGRWLYARWQLALQRDEGIHPRVPLHMTAGAERTWLLFKTPYCATCAPVERDLRNADPDANFVTVDATEDPRLAREFRIRSAPTVLLADREGEVRERLVGAAAVAAYVRNP